MSLYRIALNFVKSLKFDLIIFDFHTKRISYLPMYFLWSVLKSELKPLRTLS